MLKFKTLEDKNINKKTDNLLLDAILNNEKILQLQLNQITTNNKNQNINYFHIQ